MKIRFFGILSLGVLAFIVLAMEPTYGYLEIGESNEMPAPGAFKMGGIFQGRLSDGGGSNLTFFGDGALHEEMSWRGFLGGGKTDFYAGGSVKWVPIPDYRNQPAVGGKAEVTFGRAGDSLTVLRLVPMASKKLDYQGNHWVPYGGVPVGISASGGKSDFFANLAGGTEVRFESLRDLEFNAELGIGLTKSFSYIGIGVTYLLDTGYRGKSRR